MKKFLFTSLAVLLVLSFTATVVVLASNGNLFQGKSESNKEKNELYTVRDGVPEKIVHTTEDGEKLELTYLRSVTNETVKNYDVYVGDGNTEYHYDFDGNFIGVTLRHDRYDPQSLGTIDESLSESSGEITSEEMAVSLAKKIAVKTHGDEIDGMSLLKVTYNESAKTYTVLFGKTYGEGGFVRGESCRTLIKSSGEIRSCVLIDIMELRDLDKSIIEGVTEDEVIGTIYNELNNAIDGITSFEVCEVTIAKIDGKFAVKVYAKIKTKEGLSEDVIEKNDLGASPSIDPTYFVTRYFPLEP